MTDKNWQESAQELVDKLYDQAAADVLAAAVQIFIDMRNEYGESNSLMWKAAEELVAGLEKECGAE